MTEEMKQIQEKAEELGKLISDSGIFKQFKSVHEQLVSDTQARTLLDEHEEIFLKIRQLESDGTPIEPDDKHRLLEIQQKLHENTILQDYAQAQADFQEVMNSITDGIHKFINLPPLNPEAEGTE